MFEVTLIEFVHSMIITCLVIYLYYKISERFKKYEEDYQQLRSQHLALSERLYSHVRWTTEVINDLRTELRNQKKL